MSGDRSIFWASFGVSRKLSILLPARLCVLGKGGGDIEAAKQWILRAEIVNVAIQLCVLLIPKIFSGKSNE